MLRTNNKETRTIEEVVEALETARASAAFALRQAHAWKPKKLEV